MVKVVQRPTVQKHRLLSVTERKLLSTAPNKAFNCSRKCPVAPTRAQHAHEETLPRAVDQYSFLKQFGLVPAQSSDLHKQSEKVVDCNVIVIDDDDDDDDDDRMPSFENGCIDDLFGTTRRLRGDREANGDATSRLLQPCSRLRKLLTIDISSDLGLRTLQHVLSMMKNDSMPLNPYTVSHSLAGSDHSLDYSMFCRTPTKGMFSGRLRQREFPIRYRPMSADTHYHHYCFGRADRKKFCRRFDRGLSVRSYRLYQKCVRCTVLMDRLTAKEITDWHSSQRLRDYVSRMEENDKAAAVAINLSHASSATANDDEVIDISSDSDDDVPLPQNLMFRCHTCDISLPCKNTSYRPIREHYRTFHGIRNINLVRITQPDGSTAMQIIHVPQNASSSSMDSSHTVTNAVPTPPHLHPGASGQTVCGKETPESSNAGDPMAANCQAYQGNFTLNQSPLSHTISPHKVISRPSPSLLPLARSLFHKTPSLLNGSVLRHGDNGAAAQSDCDPDVICLD